MTDYSIFEDRTIKRLIVGIVLGLALGMVLDIVLVVFRGSAHMPVVFLSDRSSDLEEKKKPSGFSDIR